MPEQNTHNLALRYGRDNRFEGGISAERVAAIQSPPPPLGDVRAEIHDALSRPLDFPPLSESVFPEDHVILALDSVVPCAAELVAGVWEALHSAGVAASDVTIVQAASPTDEPPTDPRSRLPAEIRHALNWYVHEPKPDSEYCYLASSAEGERVYLSRRIVDADVVVTIGQIAYDPVIGYRGTNSVLYPGLSDEEAIRRARGVAHSELGPDDDRPLRTLIDEIGWLLGTQFTVQVLPAAGDAVSHVLAGLNDSVFRRGKQLLSEDWLLRLAERSELVIATVEATGSETSWADVGAALNVARKAVTRNGRILLLTDLRAEPGEGLQCIRDCAEPADAVKPLQSFLPPDFLPAMQLANAANWANISLVSNLPGDVVEELFMTPVGSDAEIRRLLKGDEPCVLIESAQSAGCQLG